MRLVPGATVILLLLILPARPAAALERLCDTANEDCRAPLLDLIKNETVGIDVAFWFMSDSRYPNELIKRWQAGVRVRVIMDDRANDSGNDTTLQKLKDAGIPMRNKTSSGIVHWKMMLFAGQNVVQFSGANYSSAAFVPIEPYKNYVDEVIYFTDDAPIVDSFKTRYDDVWTDTTKYSNFANISGTLTREYPTTSIHGDLNFVPWEDFGKRSVSRYNAETAGVDAIIYRITDRRHTDALINARGRGVPIRLISEPFQYRDPSRLWHSWNIDRLYMAGAQIRHRKHDGLTHEKLTILRGQKMAILGSSNWTSPSANTQLEHNYFTKKADVYNWSRDHFERKWTNATGIEETMPFSPLPPDWPTYVSPADASSGQSTTATLTWHAGVWAHKYDIYFGTSPDPPLFVANVELGPSLKSTDHKKYSISNLAGGTTYYWRIVSKTMANMARGGPVWSFQTSGTSGGGGGGTLPSGWQSQDVGAVGVAGSASHNSGTFTVSGAGADIWGTADAFHFAYRSLSGDGTIVARVATISGTEAWTKMGVMMRSSTAPESAHAFMLVSVSKGLAFQRRTRDGAISTNTSGGSGTAPRWVRLARAGSKITASVSTDGAAWTVVGSDTFTMPSTILVGLVGHSHNTSTLATATYDNVSITTTGSTALPSGWQSTDVGSVGQTGSATESSGTFTVKGAGADVWGTADAFHYAYRSLSGDGSIVARVATVSGAQAWTKVGVMIRGSLHPGSAHAFMLVSSGKGLAFQRRTTDGGTSTHTSGGGGGAPRWVRLTRSGSTVTAATSFDGASWATVGSDTIALPSTALVGLAVSSHDTSALATGTFDNVSVSSSTSTTLPAGWNRLDIGAVGVAGSSSESGGTFTVSGAGEDVWGTADAFHFAYGTLAGDGAIVARVASLSGAEAWTKAGVMIRESLDAASTHAFMLVSKSKGLAFQRRTTTGGLSTHTSGGSGTAPYWVKLTRSGNVVTGSVSADGSTWKVVDSDTIAMTDAVHVGLAVTSHDSSQLATATFDGVEISSP